MRMLRPVLICTTLTALIAPAAYAQEMSAEDILERLQAQRTRTLGFVDASKPAQEETDIAVAPEVDTGGTGLAAAPSADGGSGVQLTATQGTAQGTPQAGSPQIATQQTGGNAPSTSTTITGLQPVDGSGGAARIATGTDQGVARVSTGTLAATDGGEAMPTLATASAEPQDMIIDLTIYFDFDSAVLLPKSRTQLSALCQAIQLDSGQGTYQIIGHTDAKGKASYNKRLSQARADEVVRYMVDSCGIEKTRLEAKGAGEEMLKLPADPGSAENRRVEVQVLS